VDKQSNIAILGAGPAGISAYLYLQDAGYTNLTILEKNSYAGGKCKSYVKDGKSWELGAVIGTTDYDATLEIMKRFDVAPGRLPAAKRVANKKHIEEGYYPLECMFPDWIEYKETPKILDSLVRYHFLPKRAKRVFKPGNTNLSPDEFMPTEEWLKKNDMEKIGKIAAIPFTTFGYGYYEDIPAAYFLKYMEPPIMRALVYQKKFFLWKDGVQSFWQKAADACKVLYSIDIQKIKRNQKEGNVVLTTNQGTKTFDKVIITCPIDEIIAITEDASHEETELVSKIQHTNYHVHIVKADHLTIPAGFVPERLTKKGINQPMIWDQRQVDENVFTFYTLGDTTHSHEQILSSIDAEIRKLGGTMTEVLASEQWKYFPHVDSATFASGFYERFEALQGSQHMYFAGELMSFSTIEQTIRYSRELVKRFF